VMIVFLTIH